MNMYTELVNRIKQIAEPLVNVITRGDFTDVDQSKANIYPLLHILVTGGSLSNSQTVTFNVQIGCYQQRNHNNTYEIDKLWTNDNEVDNMNETLAILVTVWSTLQRDFNRLDITASDNPTLEPETNAYTNGLDGWILTLDVELPLDKLTLCE